MLQRNLKQIANESIFNPNKPTMSEKIILEVGDTKYWLIKAQEHLAYAKDKTIGSEGWHAELKQAIKLLILARTAETNDQKSV